MAISTRLLDRRADALEGVIPFVTDPTAAFAAAEAKLTKALSSVPDHALAICAWELSIYSPGAPEGIAECEHALELDRNLANAHAMIGQGKMFHRSRRRNRGSHWRGPAPQSARYVGLHLDAYAGIAKNHLGSLRASGRVASTGDRGQPKFSAAYFLLAAALAQLGRLDEARSAVKAGLALNPTYTISRARAAWTAMERRPDVSGPARAHSRRHAQGRSPRTMTAARRLAAILAADVVGYSWLMGEDETGTFSRAAVSKRISLN